MVVNSNVDLSISLSILPYFFSLFRAFTTVSCTVFDTSRRSIRDREIKLRLFAKIVADSWIPTRISLLRVFERYVLRLTKSFFFPLAPPFILRLATDIDWSPNSKLCQNSLISHSHSLPDFLKTLLFLTFAARSHLSHRSASKLSPF